MFLGIGWILLSMAVGTAAGTHFNRSVGWWFVISIFTSPIIALAFLFAAGRFKPKTDWRYIDWGGTQDTDFWYEPILGHETPPDPLPKSSKILIGVAATIGLLVPVALIIAAYVH
jgi:hypothetical protein